MLLKCLLLFTIGFMQINWCNGIKERYISAEQLKAIDGTSKGRQQLPHQNQHQKYYANNKLYNQHQQLQQIQQQRNSFQHTLKNWNKLNLSNNNSKRKFKRDVSTNPFLQKQMSQNPFMLNPFLPNPFNIQYSTQKPTIFVPPAPSPNKVNLFLQNTKNPTFSTQSLLESTDDQKKNVLLINQNPDDAVRKPNSQINGTTNTLINQNLTVSNNLGINNASTSNSVESDSNLASRVHFTTQTHKLSPELSQLIKNEAVIFPDSQHLLKTTQNPQQVLDIRR